MNKEKLQKKDGKASGKARRDKIYIKENLESLMKMDLKDIKLKNRMLDLGISDMSIQNAICVSLVQQALCGNLKAFTIIVDMLQQNPKYGEDKEHIERNYIFV